MTNPSKKAATSEEPPLSDIGIKTAHEIIALMGKPRLRTSDVARIIDRCLEEARPKWISVRDHLPKNCYRVLTYSELPFHIEVMGFDGTGFYFMTEECERVRDEGVTHWMPLPSAPIRALAAGEDSDVAKH